MNYQEQFSNKLMSLDPNDDEFVCYVDELIESIPEEQHQSLIPAIFSFFEKHPLNDCGCPGTLVHLTENYYPNYKPLLLNSVINSPSVNTIVMVNRILNSKLSQNERTEYLDALNKVANNINISQEIRDEANHFIEYQAQKNGS